MRTPYTPQIRRHLGADRVHEASRTVSWWAAMLALLLCAVAVSLAPMSRAAAAEQERIASFEATYRVQPDGSVKVTENLTWVFAGSSSHGIKRNIITRQGYAPNGQESSKFRRYPISAVTATSPTGAAADVDLQEQGAQTIIRIGSPTRTVEGTQRYQVSYTLGHVVNAQKDWVELSWNPTGGNTSIPTDAVKITVIGPGGVIQSQCFQGLVNSRDPCTTTPGPLPSASSSAAPGSATSSSSGVSPGSATSASSSSSSSSMSAAPAVRAQEAVFSASNLAAFEQVTVVAAFPSTGFSNTAPELQEADQSVPYDGTVENAGPSPRARQLMTAVSAGTAVGVPALTAAVMGMMVWRRGRDERYTSLTPGLTPGRGHDAAVTRSSRRGAVAVQFQPPAGVRPGMVGTVIDERADTVDVSATIVDLAVRGFLHMREVEAGGMFSKADWELTQLPVPPGEELLPYEQTILDGLFDAGSPVRLSELRTHFRSTLEIAQSQMYDEVVQHHWFDRSPAGTRARWTVMAGLLFAAALVVGFVTFTSAFELVGVPIGLGLAGVVVLWLGQHMPARTATGSAISDQCLGFRQYLETAEAHQIRFEEAEQIFSRYMPYAVVFGVAQRWASTFKQVAEAAAASGTPMVMPFWYIPLGTGGLGDWDNLGSGLNSFDQVASDAFAATPASSGDSGFSGGGFGGGGFAGGGGGGGGSSSW